MRSAAGTCPSSTSRTMPPPRPITSANTATPRMSKSLRSSRAMVPNTPPCIAPNATAARSIHSGTWAGPMSRRLRLSAAGRRAGASRPSRPGARRPPCAPPASKRREGEQADHEPDREVEEQLPPAHAGAGSQRGARRSGIGRCTIAAPRLERDRDPPHRVVAAGRLVDRAAQPDAGERADLMERNTNPNSIPAWRVPNISATRPDVSGTVDSHSRPSAAPNTAR